MHYTLYSRSTREPIDTVEMHVLAKAYRTAWRSMWAGDPAGPHALGALDLIIDFGRPRATHPAPALRRAEDGGGPTRLAAAIEQGGDRGSRDRGMDGLEMTAADFARQAHSGQVLEDGVTSYFEGHVLAVVDVLVEIGATAEMIAAGYLHDVVVLTTITLTQIETTFGAHVAALVGGASGVGRFAEQLAGTQYAAPERLALESAAVQTLALAHDLANLRSPLWLSHAVRAGALAGVSARLERLVLADDRLQRQVRAALALWQAVP
ncbi:MAG TPA: HD domain-containing protein [Burkholderiales bacterium]|nr:HD domain-containing protein [Burkholderiales bacterium]